MSKQKGIGLVGKMTGECVSMSTRSWCPGSSPSSSAQGTPAAASQTPA